MTTLDIMFYVLTYTLLIILTSILVLIFVKYVDTNVIQAIEKFDTTNFRKNNVQPSEETPGYYYMSTLKNDEFDHLRVKDQMRVLPDYVDQFTS